MNKIPASFELDEDDIKEAITEWINEHHDGDTNWNEYSITFKTTEKRSPGRGLPGGMNDDIVTTIISAVATKDE